MPAADGSVHGRVQDAQTVCGGDVLRPHRRLPGVPGEKYTDASPYDYYQKSKDHILINQETSDLLDRWLLLKELAGRTALPQIRRELKDPELLRDNAPQGRGTAGSASRGDAKPVPKMEKMVVLSEKWL